MTAVTKDEGRTTKLAEASAFRPSSFVQRRHLLAAASGLFAALQCASPTAAEGETSAAEDAVPTSTTDEPSRRPVVIPRPVLPEGPRRVGLQVGHWHISELPDELRRLTGQTGTSWGGVTEWQVNLEVANRTAAILRRDGIAVDVLPAVVPAGYLADVFLALHADGDPEGMARGYKAAHGSRRGPFEDQLVRCVLEEYGRITGLPEDFRITRNMLGYYAFSWSRFDASVAPHTPAAILELGFLTSAADRPLLIGRQDVVAAGVAAGIQRFLSEVPAGAPFAQDLVLPPLPPRPPGFPPGGAPPGVPPPAPPRVA